MQCVTAARGGEVSVWHGRAWISKSAADRIGRGDFEPVSKGLGGSRRRVDASGPAPVSAERPLALTLSLRGISSLANGSPLSLTLDRRSATIGRASSTDWALPDPELHISGRHCDILFRNGGYELVDNSTNGTFVNGDARRLSGPHRLKDGDVIRIGNYELGVGLAPLRTGNTISPRSAPPAQAPVPPAMPAGDDDIWHKFAASNAIDWDRGGLGGAAPAQPAPPAPTWDASDPAEGAARRRARRARSRPGRAAR